ncbi:MAG: hypothetical protein ACW99U_19645 [Candidatus Thorarchaeota archaeon]|jgi:hypothetical protein
MGIASVIGRSIGKALRDVGITVGSIGAVAALTAVSSPEVLAPLVAALPSVGGSLLLVVVPVAAKAAIDAIKHRDKA